MNADQKITVTLPPLPEGAEGVNIYAGALNPPATIEIRVRWGCDLCKAHGSWTPDEWLSERRRLLHRLRMHPEAPEPMHRYKVAFVCKDGTVKESPSPDEL